MNVPLHCNESWHSWITLTYITRLFTSQLHHSHDGAISTAIIRQLVWLWTLWCHWEEISHFSFSHKRPEMFGKQTEFRKTKFQPCMKFIVSAVLDSSNSNPITHPSLMLFHTVSQNKFNWYRCCPLAEIWSLFSLWKCSACWWRKWDLCRENKVLKSILFVGQCAWHNNSASMRRWSRSRLIQQ